MAGLDGKIALVTGASRGIGAAIAKKLAADGAYVIVNYNGSEKRALEVVSEIEAAGGQAECVQFSVADGEACTQAINDLLAKHGKINILVNNAGITRDNLLMAMKEEDYDAVLDTNLKGTFHTMKALTRNFLKLKGGRIINIASVSGVIGNPGQANYSASKAGVIGMTKAVARELATRGICVNAVAPGFIGTEMVDAMPDSAKATILDQIPMKRIGQPEDIANTVAFLASDEAAYITGQVLCVDGGMAI
ncbi:MAG: 3-oxoacyl-[acyl-carrier-protein] reductase [Lachnospiraceae bacterium]|nr:3-oxoacyl-[acyl-carrier-protein] reductase [Candidatus Merdinaster equi]